MKNVLELLKKAGSFYLATLKDGKPDVRPMGLALPINDKIYIVLAKTMNLNAELEADNNIAISTYKDNAILRLYGEVELDDSDETIQAIYEMNGALEGMFPKAVIAPYFLKNVTATISFKDNSEKPKVCKF
jgi:uncharacterized pyridoxamine 5'-phosphate oxidase family protein